LPKHDIRYDEIIEDISFGLCEGDEKTKNL